MIKSVVALTMLLMTSAATAAPAKPVAVMVLGMYHFGNPGLDTNNIKVDSVLTPQRQRELAAVAKSIATFKPTRVMVERESEAPDLAFADYAKFDDAMLKTRANEVVQIGYRVARVAGLKTVYGIDEQPKTGEPDYYPYDKVQEAAAKFGQTAVLTAGNAPIAAEVKKFEAAQKTLSVAQLLMRTNSPTEVWADMASYYNMLTIGDHDNQAGADLNAAWYLRNAKIFAKLMSVAKPGDRVLVVYGSGHGYWLRHFAREVPGYVNVDVMPYLKRAAATK